MPQGLLCPKLLNVSPGWFAAGLLAYPMALVCFPPITYMAVAERPASVARRWAGTAHPNREGTGAHHNAENTPEFGESAARDVRQPCRQQYGGHRTRDRVRHGGHLLMNRLDVAKERPDFRLGPQHVDRRMTPVSRHDRHLALALRPPPAPDAPH